MTKFEEELGNTIARWVKSVESLHKIGLEYVGTAGEVLGKSDWTGFLEFVRKIDSVTDALIIAGNLYSKEVTRLFNEEYPDTKEITPVIKDNGQMPN